MTNRPTLPPHEVHRCRECGTLWRKWTGHDVPTSDHQWSLIDPHDRQQPGPCCDNAPMGEQIERLWPGETVTRVSEPAYKYSGDVSVAFWRWVGSLPYEQGNRAYEIGCRIQQLETELHKLAGDPVPRVVRGRQE